MCRTSEHGSTPEPCAGAGIIETATARRPQGHVGGAHDGTAARRRDRLAAGKAGREAAGGGCRDHRAGWGDVKGLWVPLFLSRRAFGGSSCRIVLARRTFRRRVLNPMVVIRASRAQAGQCGPCGACRAACRGCSWKGGCRRRRTREGCGRAREKIQPFFYTADCTKASRRVLTPKPDPCTSRRKPANFQGYGPVGDALPA